MAFEILLEELNRYGLFSNRDNVNPQEGRWLREGHPIHSLAMPLQIRETTVDYLSSVDSMEFPINGNVVDVIHRLLFCSIQHIAGKTRCFTIC